ncbi:MAG: LacI family DNA-binding transcriptional regulator [Ginsengibacter sp.]
MDGKVSLKDVAKYLGVSTALVSYVINNKEKEARVSEKMAKKIRRAIVKLNYQPNQIAKSLKSGRSNTIGLIVADISNPFFSGLARIIEDEARKLGYIVIFGSSDENSGKSQDLINAFQNRQVDAFIIAPVENTEQQIKALQQSGIPVVLIDRYFPTIKADCVHIDNFRAAYNAVEHLILNGRRKIAMMAYDSGLAHMRERKNGYKAALKAHGIRYKKAWLKEASYENIEEDVADKINELLLPKLQVNAFFFATNTLAIESLRIINQSGISVPGELAIIAFDESDAFDFFYAPLSYVSQSLGDMGKGAVNLVIERINNHAKAYTNLIIKEKLVLRKSCGTKSK